MSESEPRSSLDPRSSREPRSSLDPPSTSPAPSTLSRTGNKLAASLIQAASAAVKTVVPVSIANRSLKGLGQAGARQADSPRVGTEWSNFHEIDTLLSGNILGKSGRTSVHAKPKEVLPILVGSLPKVLAPSESTGQASILPDDVCTEIAEQEYAVLMYRSLNTVNQNGTKTGSVAIHEIHLLMSCGVEGFDQRINISTLSDKAARVFAGEGHLGRLEANRRVARMPKQSSPQKPSRTDGFSGRSIGAADREIKLERVQIEGGISLRPTQFGCSSMAMDMSATVRTPQKPDDDTSSVSESVSEAASTRRTSFTSASLPSDPSTSASSIEAANTVLSFVMGAVPRLHKQFARYEEVDAAMFKRFEEHVLPNAPSPDSKEEKLLANAKEHAAKPWTRIPGTVKASLEYFRILVSTDGAWGKVTGEIDARALDVFAYLWHI
ncbi:hypothetical protein TeGR_g6342, partial [Tetraparma gracilis]